jgi:endonuclease YncB( thermonuclease family)
MKQNLLVSILIVILVFFIEGLLGFINEPKLEKELQNQLAILIENELISENVLGESSESFVSRVIDGDTIELKNGEKVRYIGIDAPETKHPTKEIECYGVKASEKNQSLVEGKIVRLDKDVSQTDKFGRLLRYVYVMADDGVTEIFVNDYLVREGFAVLSSYPPDVKYQDLFLLAQEQAREQKRGLWSDECLD